jgi:hypothetical protein
MPLMGWDDFQESIVMPYLIFADVDMRVLSRFEALNSLSGAMGLEGGYALYPAKTLIRVAFERNDDATRFAVSARPTAREGGWAG